MKQNSKSWRVNMGTITTMGLSVLPAFWFQSFCLFSILFTIFFRFFVASNSQAVQARGHEIYKFLVRSFFICSINKKQTRDSISYEGKIQHAETSKYLHYFRSPQVNPRLSENDIPCKFKNPIGCQMATYLAEGWHTAASR